VETALMYSFEALKPACITHWSPEAAGRPGLLPIISEHSVNI
jgi:hypothetical protein